MHLSQRACRQTEGGSYFLYCYDLWVTVFPSFMNVIFFCATRLKSFGNSRNLTAHLFPILYTISQVRIQAIVLFILLFNFKPACEFKCIFFPSPFPLGNGSILSIVWYLSVACP